ncbi:hypothetical protein PILCRDRAFT_11776 [Piloderma croceum F 1598]|uniref:Uncharacterized protein n=1 Tax=Piloderma croceum (strain F 1598) TaxID=765440 RepID=A0A0C3BK27_PILCF|nr:hypothetical protein PILCRDRAFT_11776 [Piloderma croceum F 1598]
MPAHSLFNSHTPQALGYLPPYPPSTCSMIPLTPPAFTPSPSPSPLMTCSPCLDEGNQEAYYRRVGYPEYKPLLVFSSPSTRLNGASTPHEHKESSSPARKRKRSSSELHDGGHSNKENIPPSKYKRARTTGELEDHILNLLEENFDKRSQFEQRMVEETQAIRREIERLVQYLIGAGKDSQD